MEYPNNDSTLLYAFFKGLTENKDLVRIIHYGDSQLEGDRVTSYFRNRLQSKFGGSGMGMFAVVEVNNGSTSIQKSYSDNWNRYTLFGRKNASLLHKHFGALLSYSRFTYQLKDSMRNDSTMHEAWINLRKSSNAFTLARKYRQCKLIYGYNKKAVALECYKNDSLFKTETLPASNDYQILTYNFENTPNDITFKFKGKDSPNIFAISLDDTKGIAVDNVPLRGSSGLDFTRSDLNLLKRMYDEMNVKMVILQFGVNVAPNIVSDYTFYENWFYSQLKAIKRICPDMAIVVIGISDMSRKTGNSYESFPNIEKIRDAQKKAAFKANCAFWDLYQAMGGKNSMPSWVLAKPSLASKDFTHFNYNGAKIVSEMFSNAFLNEYYQYLINNQKKK